MIGIWRSERENFALFCSMSPIVAIRIVWLSAAVVTPRSAARSKRGLMVISGCARRAADPRRADTGKGRHLVGDLVRNGVQLNGVVAAEKEHDVPRIVAGAAAVLALEARAGVGDRGERGRERALDLGARLLAVLFPHDETWPSPTLTRSKVRSVFGFLATIRAISSATTSLCLSVEPGGSVKLTSDWLTLTAGWNVIGKRREQGLR